MDEITKAYVAKIEAERDEALELVTELEFENDELRHNVSVLTGQVIRIQQEHSYDVA